MHGTHESEREREEWLIGCFRGEGLVSFTPKTYLTNACLDMFVIHFHVCKWWVMYVYFSSLTAEERSASVDFIRLCCWKQPQPWATRVNNDRTFAFSVKDSFNRPVRSAAAIQTEFDGSCSEPWERRRSKVKWGN